MPDHSIPEMKRCSKCKEWFPATNEYFPRQKQQKCGLHSNCKKCHNADKKIYRETHKEELAIKNAEYQRTHPDIIKAKQARFTDKHREQINAQAAQRRAENPEHINSIMRRYRERNAERIRQQARENYDPIKQGEYSRRYAAKHPETAKAYRNSERGKASRKGIDHRRMARERNLPDTFTAEDWQHALEYFEHRCAACGNENVSLSADHWIPLASSDCPGTIPENIVPLCPRCNSSKLNRNAEKWLIRKLGLERATVILSLIGSYLSDVKKKV